MGSFDMGFPLPITDGIILPSVTSIQTGIGYGNITINAVDTKRTLVRAAQQGGYVNSGTAKYPYFYLSSPTLITGGNAYSNGRWEVIEFSNIKSIQSGQVNLSASGIKFVGTVTISDVNTNKSSVFVSVVSTPSTISGNAAWCYLEPEFNSSTSITVGIAFASNNTVTMTAASAFWTVVEWL